MSWLQRKRDAKLRAQIERVLSRRDNFRTINPHDYKVDTPECFTELYQDWNPKWVYLTYTHSDTSEGVAFGLCVGYNLQEAYTALVALVDYMLKQGETEAHCFEVLKAARAAALEQGIKLV